jgi:hypothetical protein
VVALKPKHKRIGPSIVAWIVLAIFFVAFGLFFYINSLGIDPISDDEFISAANDTTLPLGAVSESGLAISRYGSLGFVVAGVVFLFFAGSALREG